MKTVVIVLVILLGLFGGIGYKTWDFYNKQSANKAMTAQRRKAPAVVSVATVRVRDIINSYDATGSLESPQSVKITPKVSGLIEKLTLHEGDLVTKGMELVRLDPSQVKAQVQQAQAGLAEAQYRLAQAKLTQAPTNASVHTQIQSQSAGLASAQSDYDQVCQSIAAQLATAAASVRSATSKVESAAAQVENATASVDSAQANLDNAQTKYNRYYDLYKQGYVAAQDVDDTKAALAVQKANLEVAKGQLTAAKATLDAAKSDKQSAEEQASIVTTKTAADKKAAHARLLQAKAALTYAKSNTPQIPAYQQSLAALQAQVDAARAAVNNAKAQLADTVLKSPLDGQVTTRYMDPGAMASPGQPILAVQFMHQVWVTLGIPEDVYIKLHLGQPSTVRFDEYPGHTFSASIIQLNPSADPTSRLFQVRVLMDNAKGLFKPGMFAHVSLETEHVAHAVTVPREAVQYDKTQAPYVNIFTPDPKDTSTDPKMKKYLAVHRPVVVGASDASNIAITLGVQLGEKVVTMSAMPLVKDNMPVRLGDSKGKRGAGKPGAADGAGKPGEKDTTPSENVPATPGKHGGHGHGAPPSAATVPASTDTPETAPAAAPGAGKWHGHRPAVGDATGG